MTLALNHVTPICVDQYMNYPGCIVAEFIPVALACWLSAVWRSSVGNYSPCVGSSGPCTVKWSWHIRNIQMKPVVFVAHGLFILSSANPFSAVSLGLGLFCMPPVGVGLLMKVVFNLVKCCRDRSSIWYLYGWDSITTVNGVGFRDGVSFILSIYRGHYGRKDRVSSRELMWT